MRDLLEGLKLMLGLPCRLDALFERVDELDTWRCQMQGLGVPKAEQDRRIAYIYYMRTMDKKNETLKGR